MTGPTVARLVVEVHDRRASVVESASATPTATLTLDTETFNALLCGRWTADDARAAKRLALDGDIALASAVAGAMSYVI